MILGTSMGVAAGGLATKLLTSGIQRAGSLIFQKAMRVSKIEQSIRTQVQRNPNVKAAISDFEIVIGTRFGEYTQQLAQFLEELERSGLITAMVEDALLERSSPEVQASFTRLYERAFPTGPDEAAALYEKLTISFRVTFRELSQDKVISDVLKLVHRDIAARLDRVDEALATLNQKSSKDRHSSLSELQPILLKIARALQSTTKQVRIETNKGPRWVDISKIYVPPKLKHRETKRNARTLAEVTAAVRPRARLIYRPDEPDSEWSVSPSYLQTITYGDLKLSFSRVVILGDPGGGKSTICQNLCFDLAKQAATALGAANKSTPQLQKFPIRIVLRLFEKARLSEPQLSILEFIVRDLENHVTADRDELREAIVYLLSTGVAVLAFDGLDEILATAQRREFVELVVSFTEQFPLCASLITSRLVGYDDAPLSKDFEELVLERFDQTEIQSYLRKFFKVVSGRTDAEAGQYAQDFLRQTAVNADDLRRNPLMLGLMAWLFNVRGDVPSNRPDIYRECAVLMFERWDPDRDIKADVPADFDKLHLFSSLASKIFGVPELAVGVEVGWLAQRIRDYLENLYENKAQAIAATKAIVKFLTGRAWVMTDVGDGIFAFTHQTFLEYFFARFVDEGADTVQDVFDEILPHVLLREWDVVAHLSLQIKTHRSPRRQNQAIEYLLSELSNGHTTEELRALVLFSARSLEYLIGSETQAKLLVEKIYREVVESTDDEEVLLVLRYCSQCCAERRPFINKLLLDLIVGSFRNEGGAKLSGLAKALSIKSQRVRGSNGSATLSSDFLWAAQHAARKIITERAGKDEFFSALAWSWFGIVNESLLKRHGLISYFNAQLQVRFGVDGLTGLVLTSSERYAVDLPSQITGLQVLSKIGELGFAGPLLEWTSLDDQLSGATAPIPVWARLLKELKGRPQELSGAFFCFLVVSEFSMEKMSDSSLETLKKARDKTIADVLKMKSLQQVSYHPAIVARANASVFRLNERMKRASIRAFSSGHLQD